MQRRTGRPGAARLIVVGVASAVAMAGCSTTPPAAPSTSPPSTPGSLGSTPSSTATFTPRPADPATVTPDFDGDKAADVAVGTGARPGRVSVRYANGRSVDFGRQDVDAEHPDSTGFGQALLARDLNADGFTDLVVADPDAPGAAMFWIYGSAAGLDLAGGMLTSLEGFPGAGRALALVTAPSPVLVAGGGSAAGTPLVLTHQLGSDGRPAGDPQQVTPESLGLPPLPTGSRFGTSLAATGALLAIGAPAADVGAARRAGAVYTIDYRQQPLRANRITQDSPGVPDNAQPGDRFGAALAADAAYLVVGVPGEDRTDERGRNQARTGMVQAFRIAGADLEPEPAIDQNNLPGNVEADDGFGSAVSMVRPCGDAEGVLVGAFAEAIGRNEQAGSAWLVPIGPNYQCDPLQLYDGEGGLGEEAQANTLVGSAVGVLRQKSGGDTLVIVAQGTAEEGVLGRVLTLDHPYTDAPVEILSGLRVAEERMVVLSSPAG